MSDARAPRALPPRPSREHLRKQAKRLARERNLQLSIAQRLLAAEYGERSWAELMHRVAAMGSDAPTARSRLARAAEIGDLTAVRSLLGETSSPNGDAEDEASPLWFACVADAAPELRLAVCEALLAAGANAREGMPGSTPLHAAAAHGPLKLVELLITHGGIEWEEDSRGWSALDAARNGSAPDRDAIVILLNRPVIIDPAFRAAVAAIQAGDVAELTRHLDAAPQLLRMRAIEPDCYQQAARPQYFRDPKLFWFIANNPRLVQKMPSNMVQIANAMLERGIEAKDIQYALELVMTGASAREDGQQLSLMRLLLAAGAKPSDHSIAMALAHREIDPIRALLAAGAPMTAAIAAALGDCETLKRLLPTAPLDEIQMALAQAVLNGQTDTARVALDAGADPNRFMPVHAHSTPLHQAALLDDIALIDLLLTRGAQPDIRDQMWNATPLEWATHEGKAVSRARLSGLSSTG
jgi:ankyrin repeat protein